MWNKSIKRVFQYDSYYHRDGIFGLLNHFHVSEFSVCVSWESINANSLLDESNTWYASQLWLSAWFTLTIKICVDASQYFCLMIHQARSRYCNTSYSLYEKIRSNTLFNTSYSLYEKIRSNTLLNKKRYNLTENVNVHTITWNCHNLIETRLMVIKISVTIILLLVLVLQSIISTVYIRI